MNSQSEAGRARTIILPFAPTMELLTSQPPNAQSQRKAPITTLWAHLARRDTRSTSQSASASTTGSLPSNPIDRLGTSTRVLLLDTQSNMEKLSDLVKGLTDRVEDRTKDIPRLQSVMEEKHDETIVTLSQLGEYML